MKLHYHPESDSLFVDFADRPSVESREVADGVVADFDSHGKIVGLDIEHASKILDLSTLETDQLPSRRMRVG